MLEDEKLHKCIKYHTECVYFADHKWFFLISSPENTRFTLIFVGQLSFAIFKQQAKFQVNILIISKIIGDCVFWSVKYQLNR